MGRRDRHGAWRGGTSVIAGQGASANGGGCVVLGGGAYSEEPNAIVIGSGADAQGEEAIAVGRESIATCSGSSAFGVYSCAAGREAIQLGCGTNETERTLQFLDWRLVGSDGKIPTERLAAASDLSVIKGMSEAQIAELKELLK